MLGRFTADLRYARRALGARPAATLGLISVLAIGMGLSATMFALADPFLSRPLPFRSPNRLVVIEASVASSRIFSWAPSEAVVPTLTSWRARTDLFADVGAFGAYERVRLHTPEGAASILVRPVTVNLLSVLGLPYGMEGPWSPQAQEPRAVVLTSRAYRALGVAREGRSTLLTESGDSLLVAGELPPDFIFPYPIARYRGDALRPAAFGAVVVRRPGSLSLDALTLIARLQPTVTLAQVEAALGATAAGPDLELRIEPLSTYLAGRYRPLAVGALVAGLAVAFVCVANVVGLIVARSVYKARDFAICQMLGASPVALLRVVVLELVLVSGASAAAGLFLTLTILGMIGRVMPEPYVSLGPPMVTGRVVLFLAMLALVTTSLCALPAWLGAGGASPRSIGKSHVGESRTRRTSRFLLAGGQVAVTTVVLTGAVALTRSYAHLWLQDSGYTGDPRVARVSYPQSYGAPRRFATIETTLAVLGRLPGVDAVGAATNVGGLLDGVVGGGGPVIETGGRRAMLIPSEVTWSYFSAVGARLIAGRPLAPEDRGWSAVVVNETLASRWWPGQPASAVVGQTVSSKNQSGRVVGVIQDVLDRALDAAPAGHLYKPLDSADNSRLVTFIVRGAEGQTIADPMLRRAIVAVEPAALVESIDSVTGRLAETVTDRSFATLVLGLFSAAAMSITGVGVFALVAFATTRRTREIAVRVAVGAQPNDVCRLVIMEALLATLAGGLVGMLFGVALGRLAQSLFYRVGAGDFATLSIVIACLVGVTVAAAWWPTRRALRIQPSTALRVE